MIGPEQAVAAAIAVCFAGAMATLLLARYRELAGWASFVTTTASAVLVGGACTQVLLFAEESAHPVEFWRRAGIVVRLHVDGLSSLFLLLCIVIAIPAALYSIRYLDHYAEYGVARYYPNFLLFLAGIYALLTSTDMVWVFFLAWQLMTLPSFVLVRFEKQRAENRRAALRYLVMMEIACAAAMLGGRILSPAGISEIDAVSAAMPAMLAHHAWLAATAFGLLLIGFGIKAGMWPFGQMWLPDAHPAAPSPVSAMLSGVMIKTGVYGLIRSFLWLVPASAIGAYPIRAWGAAVTVLGTLTLFVGTMQALQQEQSKRLLAFHSIGQVGYILFGLGTSMALLPAGPGVAPIAAVAMTGALLHVLNHGLFKGLLFFNAGSMLCATGTQDLNRVSGLIRFMPLTAATALIASFSISGVPLFNGFVSKWTLYVAAIRGTDAAHYLVVCAVVAIFTSGLTLASFIKFFGASFLSRTSALVMHRATERRLEATWPMQSPQVFLASLCVLLGLVPALGFGLVARTLVHGTVSDAPIAAVLGGHAAVNPLLGVELLSSARFMPLGLTVVFALMIALAIAISRLGRAERRTATPWLCGYATQAEANRYVAHNFYSDFKRYFRWLGGTRAVAGRRP